MRGRWWKVIGLVAIAVFIFTPAIAKAAIGNEGRIIYVKEINRDASTGEIDTSAGTGQLFLKDISSTTATEIQVTNYSGTFSILNPQFNSDGTQVLFTSDEASSGKFSVYLVTADTTNNSGVGILLDGSGSSGDGYKYAALSPDDNLVAYTRYVSANETDLDIYNIQTGYSQVEVVSLANIPDPDGGGKTSCIVRHPVFIDNDTVAFVAEVDGIQNIYTVDLTTYAITDLTGDTEIKFQYGRLRSAWRGNNVNSLIYAKRGKVGSNWDTNWDIYIMDVSTQTEYQVTNTSRVEYDGAFYGDGTTDIPLALTNGNMFYASTIVGTADNIWQTDYDTGGTSNGMKVQRTAETDDVGLVDWGPAVVVGAPSYSITDTQLTYTQGSPQQVFTAPFTDATTLGAGTQRTTEGNNIYNPELGRRQIVYTILNSNNPIYIMNADGTNMTEFESAENGVNKLYPSLSPDGKWVVWSENGGLKIKRSNDPTGTATDLAVGTQAEDPKISPDSSLLIWVENTGGVRQIKSVKISLDPTTGNASVSGTPTTLGGNTGNFNDVNPSFSPDGKTIVFVSNRDGTKKIYTMDSNGSNVQALPITATDPAYPVYSPTGDGSICFVATEGTDRTIHIYDGTTVTDLTRKVDGDEISWNLIYTPGEIFGERSMPERVASGGELNYRINIDVDEKNKPNSFVLKEIVPNEWSSPVLKIDGNTSTDSAVKSDTPVSGLKTIELTFVDGLSGVAGDVSDHIVEFKIDVGSTTGTQSVTGKLVYNLPDEDNHETTITGNSRVLIANPYLPFDKYSYQGATRYEKPDGVVDTEDLLYAIDCWADNIQIEGGYGALWPENLANYDDIILDVIEIWADSTYKGGYKYEPDSSTNPDVAHEMYWMAGTWSD